jgi:hypothetical protein
VLVAPVEIITGFAVSAVANTGAVGGGVVMNGVSAEIGPTVALPEVACDPDHPPLAVQEVASLVDQDRVDVAPLEIVVGFAVRTIVNVGAGVEGGAGG